MAKTTSHDSRTHLPKEITITISTKDGESFDYKIYGVTPAEIIDEYQPAEYGYSYIDFEAAVDLAATHTKEVIANLEKESRSACESAHDLSEIRNRQSKKDQSITR